MNRPRLAVAIVGLCALSASCAADRPEFRIGGWREVVVAVADIDAHRRFFEQVGGWEQRASGPTDPRQLRQWDIPELKAVESLMANPGTDTGMVRLVQIEGEHPQIRSNSQIWDTGGILDINVRVTDLDEKFRELQRRGWQAPGDPVRFKFGPFDVTEWIARGPDGLTFALIERHEPPLEGWPHLKDFSRTFNATQVVADMPRSLGFYRDVLGFKKYMHHRGASSGDGTNVLGLPASLAREIVRDVWILHPQGTNEGSVELLAFEGVVGRDFSQQASPPNTGMLALRFPVEGLDALARHLASSGVSLEAAPATVSLPPYGLVRSLAVESPNGSRLEFFEAQKTAR